MRTAITKSYNIPAVKAMVEITPEVGVEYLKKFGFTSILDTLTELPQGSGNFYTDVNSATAIGGITKGVSNLELTAAYATIANNGTYIKPVFYTKILDSDGNVVDVYKRQLSGRLLIVGLVGRYPTNYLIRRGSISYHLGFSHRTMRPCALMRH